MVEMRRERRQHGIARTYRILPPPLNPRLVNSLTPPLTGRLFTKLPSKQNKARREVWTGQVHWMRSNDIASSNCKLLTCRVMTRTGPDYAAEGIVSEEEGNVDDNEEKGGEALKRENDEDSYNKKEDGGGSEDNDGSMSFYDVGMMMMGLDDDEEDGWCLV